MAENTKNLCAQIPIDLHDRVSQAKDRAGQTTSQYITELLIEYFKMKEEGVKEMDGTRTMAFQIPTELFERLKDHLDRESARTGKKVSQKEFVLDLIRQALDKADREGEQGNADLG